MNAVLVHMINMVRKSSTVSLAQRQTGATLRSSTDEKLTLLECAEMLPIRAKREE